MSEVEAELLMSSKEERWNNSVESIITQKVTKLTKSESMFQIPGKFDSDITFMELELREINADEPKKRNWELVRNKSRFPRIIQTRSLLRDELEMLKINMSIHDKIIALRESQLLMHRGKKKCWANHSKFVHKLLPKARDLLTEIEASESAKTDTVIWKFLKRGPSLRKDFITTRKLLMEIQNLHLAGTHIQNSQPARVTCPNCRFFITTNVKRVSTIKANITSFVFGILGLCVVPHIFYAFKDTVHLCPLCKVYLGFCPAYGIRGRRAIRALERTQLSREKDIKNNEKMVSASSTSAKNLFVESKLRLADRVQVNVNNIAAVARQIQRGSKANENIITAAKNFALQEAAIANSETNLKKLKLLTTHINNQLDSLHNSSTKMELVLEQVRSMQR